MTSLLSFSRALSAVNLQQNGIKDIVAHNFTTLPVIQKQALYFARFNYPVKIANFCVGVQLKEFGKSIVI